MYDSGDYPATLEKIKKLVGWDEFPAFRAQAEADRRRVGIGLGCYVEGTGSGPYEGGWVKVHTDGSVAVATGLTSQVRVTGPCSRRSWPTSSESRSTGCP